jgi:hypothetical protein
MSPCVKKCLWVHEKVHGKQCEAWKMSPGAGQSGNWYEMEGYCAELMCLNGHIRRAGGWQLRIPQCANYLGQY